MSKKISELTNASTLDGSELFECVQDGSNKKTAVLTIYTGDGSLSGDRTVDLNGHILWLKQGFNFFLLANSTPGQERAWIYSYDGSSSAQGGVSITSNSDLGNTIAILSVSPTPSLYSEILMNGDNQTILIYGDGGITLDSDAGIVMTGLVAKDFADDAAAASGGVPVEGIYHTSGTLKIRLI